jgi:hypothetical protein
MVRTVGAFDEENDTFRQPVRVTVGRRSANMRTRSFNSILLVTITARAGGSCSGNSTAALDIGDPRNPGAGILSAVADEHPELVQGSVARGGNSGVKLSSRFIRNLLKTGGRLARPWRRSCDRGWAWSSSPEDDLVHADGADSALVE